MEGLRCTVQYKKILMVYFVIQTVMSFKKIKSFSHFLKNYIRFFSKPLLFMFLFTGATRALICSCRNFRITNFYKICALLYLLPLSGMVENEKRIKDLSIYFLVETVQAFVNSVKAYLKIDDKKFDEKLNKVLYSVAVGCLMHMIVNHV